MIKVKRAQLTPSTVFHSEHVFICMGKDVNFRLRSLFSETWMCYHGNSGSHDSRIESVREQTEKR